MKRAPGGEFIPACARIIGARIERGLAAPALIGSQHITTDLGIWRAAQATISRYGDDAGPYVAPRADELMAEGDVERRAVWGKLGC